MVGAGGLSLVQDDGGSYGALSVSLVAKSQGFRPSRFCWKVDEASSAEQTASGEKVDLTIPIGSDGDLRYDHQFQVVAYDDSGNAATGSYAIHLEPPSGFLLARYDEPRSTVGAVSRRGANGPPGRVTAYRKVLVFALTKGLLGHVRLDWSPEPEYEDAPSPDFHQAVFRMLVNGDPGDVESYEGVSVKVHAIDEIGQSVSLEKFVDAIVASH